MLANDTAIPTQYIRDAAGEPIAVILPIAAYEHIKSLLQERGFVWDDEGEIRPALKEQLLQQSAQVQAGERGVSLDEAINLLGLDYGSTAIDARAA